jgi:hypothetical protein
MMQTTMTVRLSWLYINNNGRSLGQNRAGSVVSTQPMSSGFAAPGPLSRSRVGVGPDLTRWPEDVADVGLLERRPFAPLTAGGSELSEAVTSSDCRPQPTSDAELFSTVDRLDWDVVTAEHSSLWSGQLSWRRLSVEL